MHNKKQQGFTLLELLVTLVIIGILVSFVAVSFTANSYKHEIRAEATQLARKIELLRRVATTHNETWGVSISRNSYRFLKHDPDKNLWSETNERLYRIHNLSDHMYLQFQGDQNIPALHDNLDELQPEMMVLPGGEMTPFILHCSREYSEHVHILESDGLNRVELFSNMDPKEEDEESENE